jgi:hypothetical protein
MKETLKWEQGDSTYILLTKNIIMIEEKNNSGNKSCDIYVTGLEDPLRSSLSKEDILKQLFN